MQREDKPKLLWTGERFVPELRGNIHLEHLHRYAMACEYVKNKVVLDIACGEGYGSMMLSTVASRVTGVDISKEVIDFAQAKYRIDNINFKTGSCDKIPLEDSSIDVVVTFETIEHHDQHDAMMKEIKRILKPDGLLIISSPDKYNYSDLPGKKNQYHLKELYYEEFKSLLETYFCNIAIYGQRVIFGSGIFPEKSKSQTITYDIKKVEQNIVGKSRFKGIAKPLYFIAVASDSKLPSAISSIFEQPLIESEAFTNYSAELKKQVLQLHETVINRDKIVSKKKQLISEKEQAIAKANTLIAEKEQTIAKANNLITEKEQTIDKANTLIAEKEQAVAKANNLITLKEQTIDNANTLITEKEQALTKANTLITEKEQAVAKANTLIAQKERELSKKIKTIANYQDELYSVYTSHSWRYTAPLRKIGSILRRGFSIVHWPHIRAVIKRIYFLLPARIRCSIFMENLKNRFKNAEIKR